MSMAHWVSGVRHGSVSQWGAAWLSESVGCGMAQWVSRVRRGSVSQWGAAWLNGGAAWLNGYRAGSLYPGPVYIPARHSTLVWAGIILLLRAGDLPSIGRQDTQQLKKFTGSCNVKASYGVGLKSAQPWGYLPMLDEMSIQRHKVNSYPFSPPSPNLCLHKKPVLEISRQIQTCSTNRIDLPHSSLFLL